MEDEISNFWSPWVATTTFSWEKVLGFASKRQYKKNDIILWNGQIVDELYYLNEGQIKMSYLNFEGEKKSVWYIESGNIFGEAPFFLGRECSMLISCERDSIVYAFDRKAIMEIILHNSEIMVDMLTRMASKIQTLTRQIYDLSLNSPKMRLYRMLYFMTKTRPGNTANISQQDLADLLGLHRVTVNKLLVALKNDGIIEHDIKRKRIVVSNPSILLELIEKEQNT
ncbi:Crp/Fnr family transcriptional regulator [Desulfosporosinus sp. SYSU MS00001]|uniref:Crp/Fnr family transcriptional regulator n=1 Tax=Desulfosporosinus sp. SYSU MS00001 TaxID=3416284 RepID=UPI003CF7F7B5